MTEWLSRPTPDGGLERVPAGTRTSAGERMLASQERMPAAGERMPVGERMPAAQDRMPAAERLPGGEGGPAVRQVAGRDRMPWTMVLALLISAVSVGAWVAGGLLLIVAPQRALVTIDVLPVWIAGVAAGVAANAAVVVGGMRRAAWARWIVAMQALVMIVLLSAAEQGGWAVAGTLLLAVQCVLITMPSANDWFGPQPAARTTSERAPRHPG